MLEAALQGRDRVTLDIDASAVHAKKKTARRTCKGKRGCTPMIGHIAETGQVVKSGLRKGSVPPAARNREFFERCSEALPEGARAAWQPMPLDDGAFSETGSAARTVHAMAGTPEAFCLAVQRKAVDRPG